MDRKSGSILIVDDDEDILVAGQMLLKRHFETVATANRPEHIPKLYEARSFDAVLLDMNFGAGETSGSEGIDWLKNILKLDPDAVVILITAYSAVDTAVEAMKLGATDFIEKPWQNEKLIATLNAAVRFRQSRNEAKVLKQTNRVLTEEISRPSQPILGTAPAINQVLSLIERTAPTEANVLILGENGTGKELVAHEIHRLSERAAGVFLTVDLGSIAETLFESELFGHKKGAFTDAREDRIGRFEAADGGTLFLDEIGNIPLHLQAKLLTVLEQRMITPVGANQAVPFNVRVISATNVPVHKLSDDSRFRQDLLYRLNTVEVHLPPLSDRREDIPILANAFVEQYARKYGRSVTGVSQSALDELIHYTWPGNVRALRHAVERAVILSESEELQPQDFQLRPASGQPAAAAQAGAAGADEVTLEELEHQVIDRVLRKHKGNVSRAAKELGITRTSLYRRMDKYGL
jgi:DNA-binding NtrC family response regulator